VQRVYEDARDQLFKVARQLGRTKDEAEAFVDAVLQTPEIVTLHFQALGLADNLEEAKALERQMRHLDGMTATMYLNAVNNAGRMAGYAAEGVLPGAPEAPHVGGHRGAGQRGRTDHPAGGQRGRVAHNYGRGIGINQGRVLVGPTVNVTTPPVGAPIDYDLLAAAVGRAAPLYGDVTVLAHNYGDFQRQMMRDRAAAGLDGVDL
jgi:hypothetical protein